MKFAVSIVVLIVLGLIAAASAAILTVTMRANALPEVVSVGEQQVNVLVASRDLPALTILDAEAVEQVSLPVTAAPAGFFSEGPELIGRVLSVPMRAGQAFIPSCFPRPGSGLQVAGMLAPGKRAVSVSLTDYSGLDALLYPGCTVDVLAAFRLSSDNKFGTAVSTTLLENVQVLAVEYATVASEESEDEPRAGSGSRRPGRSLLVTLMVDGKQAEALQLASEHGTVSLALRNPTDTVPVKEDPTLLNEGQIAQLADVMAAMVREEQEQAEREAAAKTPEPAPRRATARTNREVSVQVIRGSASETLSFSHPQQ